MKPPPNFAVRGIVAGIAVCVLIFVVVSLFGLGGGATFTDRANEECERHNGVARMDAHQGYVICRDGEAFTP